MKESVLVTNRLQIRAKTASIWQSFHSGLIVSCQVTPGTAIDVPAFICAQALTVEAAGALAIRAEGIANVTEVSAAMKVPVIGLVKAYDQISNVYITPRIEDVLALVKAGADIVAVDATQRVRWGGQTLEEFFRKVRMQTDIPLLADIDCLENAKFAALLGFDAVATTLNGFTDQSSPSLPNIDLLRELTKTLNIPVIAEGGYSTPAHVRDALNAGAWAVCVGTAITNPFLLTRQFLEEAF